MEFIDPQLLAFDSMQVDQSEAESHVNFLQDGNFPYYCPSPEPVSPYKFDFASAYPEEPLPEPAFQPNFYHDPPLFAGPSYAPPGFNTKYEDSSTQTDDGTIRVAPVAPVNHSKYGLRPRGAQGANPSGRRNANRPGTQNKAQPRRRMKAPHKTQKGKALDRPVLSAPLSQLAADLPNIPKMDLHAFVHRDRAERIMRGKITRPINAFMLYRQAYQHHVQFLLSTTNNIDVSRTAGASWRMESREVKARFHAFADIEKAEHARHFPNYSYFPGRAVMAEYGLP
ncbi:hypothetical protein GGR58DRAFT_523599 [Xylaria digitata]|nr:hypothetical protein GGR58DRAFT_523599 [Xylaria digitata]